MLRLLTTGETPPKGWRHKEKHSGLSFPLEQGVICRDYLQFLGWIKEHRRATGGDLDIGWEARLQDELCQEHPEYPCKEEGAPSGRRLTLDDIKGFLHSASMFIDQGGKFVDSPEAERRANICKRCPMNGPVTGCFGCNGIANAAMDFVAQRKTSVDQELNSCQICGCFLRVKVWMPLDSMSDSPELYPSFCWRR